MVDVFRIAAILAFTFYCSMAAGQQAAEISRAYCERADQNFDDQCAGLDLNVSQAQCDANKTLARNRCDELRKDWIGSALYELGKHEGDLVAGVVAVLAASALAALAYVNKALREQVAKFKLRLADPFIERAPTYQSFAVNAMVVGIGGVGKTSIIRALSASKEANPDSATATNSLYSLATEVTVSRGEDKTYRKLTRIFISDHVGQDSASILKAEFYRSQRLSKLPKCLIFVVDLFSSTSEESNNVEKRTAFDEDRIKKSIGAFTPEMIRVLTEPLSPGDQIILFINKIDCLKSITEEKIRAAKDSYSVMKNILFGIRGAQLSVIVGSAELGWGVVGSGESHNIFAQLTESASPTKN